ncbi:MAG: ABC transporter permease [Acidobacteria bacterium]|nr:ABC transporter permease [Acidobacteriota bacterium]
MRKTWAVALKEIRQAMRDPLSLTMLLGVPTFMLLLYGYALNFDVRHVALAVQDLDRSAASRRLVASFVNSTYFDQTATPAAGEDLERYLQSGLAKAILVIPADFSAEVARGDRAQVQLILDGSDANTATTVLGYASALVADANVTMLESSLRAANLGAPPVIDYQPRVWYNPELRSTHFLVPGLIGFILMLTAVLSTALSVVREKERGTMEQLRVAPLRPAQLIVGKSLPFLIISLMATVMILVAARLLFGVVIMGPHLHLFFATLLYLIGALGFGLLISTLANTQAWAFQVGITTSMLPALLLSGFIFPIAGMPRVLQWITYAVPARYYLVVLRGIILKGAGLAPFGTQMMFLGIYAIIVLTIASVRLSRREA